MLASGSPMLTRTPSLPKARTDSARSPASAANSALFCAQIEPDKVALGLRNEPPELPQSGRDPVPLVHQALYPFYNVSEMLQ